MVEMTGFVKAGSPEAEALSRIDLSRIPRHIAVIMDGNGRWAGRRSLPRLAGHRAGIQSVRETVEACARLDVGYLTLYAFSVENWKRPRTEIEGLMLLIREYMGRELDNLIKANVRFRAIGRYEQLDPLVVKELERGMRETSRCTGLNFNIALNYGGRAEILDGIQRLLAELRKNGHPPPALDEERFSEYLYTAGMPDPDLLIRTSGEMRISNFLLWQIAYSEIYVTPTLWPDFRTRHLFEAIVHFQQRERRYGGLSAPGDSTLPEKD
ncbi:MAG: isoprenyl transferase [Acidobacteriota bacterium]